LNPDMVARNKANVDEASYRAAVQRVKAGPDVARRVDEIHAGIPDILRRMYVSPDNGKGRQTSYFAPADHMSPAQFHRPGVDARGRMNKQLYWEGFDA
jgi:hypothetical protein